MKIYSDVLTRADLFRTTAEHGNIWIDEIQEIKKPRVRKRGWEVKTCGSTNRKTNTGKHGAGDVTAATWDQHGEWFALLYVLDPDARIAIYKDARDFHMRTQDKYALTVG